MKNTVRAKFICRHAEKQTIGDTPQVNVRFSAVADNEGTNKSWSKWTPSGELSMTISNPDLVDRFEVGKAYFLDIADADE